MQAKDTYACRVACACMEAYAWRQHGGIRMEAAWRQIHAKINLYAEGRMRPSASLHEFPRMCMQACGIWHVASAGIWHVDGCPAMGMG